MHHPLVIIALAGVAAFVFGAVYYMSLGKFYQAALDKVPVMGVGAKPPLGPMVVCLAAEWIVAAVLYLTLTNLTGAVSIGAAGGAMAGAVLGAGFMATSTVVNNAFPGRKVMLSVIDSVHWIVVAAIEGAVIGALT